MDVASCLNMVVFAPRQIYLTWLVLDHEIPHYYQNPVKEFGFIKGFWRHN
jgi:hypothetical protein